MKMFCISNKDEIEYKKAIINHYKSLEIEYNSSFFYSISEYGKNIKISIKKKDIKTLHNYNRDEIKELENEENEVSEEYQELLDSLFSGKDIIKKVTIEDAYLVEYEYEIKGNKNKQIMYEKRPVGKINNKWYLLRQCGIC